LFKGYIYKENIYKGIIKLFTTGHILYREDSSIERVWVKR